MQELRLVAVSEDGTYAVLAVPGRGGRFSLPIDDRLRTVARGQFSRLAQYEIEVENPLRPKEIQDRIRAGETADEIADAAGIPIDRVRRFEGPVLAEREYRAQEAQRSTVRGHTESGPGPRLGEIVAERLADAGAPQDGQTWDSRKRTDGSWQVQLQFTVDGRPQIAEWVFDPRRRQVIPADDLARRLCLPQVDWPGGRLGGLGPAAATVTPIGSRLSAHHGDGRADPDRLAAGGAYAAPAGQAAAPGSQPGHEPVPERLPYGSRPDGLRPREARADPADSSTTDSSTTDRSAAGPAGSPGTQPAAALAAAAGREADSAVTDSGITEGRDAGGQPGTGLPAADAAEHAEPETPTRPGRKAAGGRGRRSSVPSWDEIMLGNSRQPD